jgi:putative ABC transport system permease protein
MRRLRPLLRAPSFTLPAIAGLALAIGAATAVFSVFSAMLLRPLGIRDPQRVAAVWRADEAHGQKRVEIGYRDYLEWRKAEDLDDIALASSVNLYFPFFAGGEPEHVDGTTVTGSFGGAAAVLAVVAAVACVEPAARAARIDPARALRSE